MTRSEAWKQLERDAAAAVGGSVNRPLRAVAAPTDARRDPQKTPK